MKATLVSKENNSAKLTMDFSAEEFDNAVNQVYRKERNRYVIDGFRKGKAPRSIIESHYGEGVFFEDAINDLFNANYPDALKELKIEVIDRPQVDFSEIGKKKPLTMTIDVATYPVIEVNEKDYFGIDVEQIKSDVSDEDVDKEIEALRSRNARMELVDRPIKEGDTVLLDYKGFIGDEQFEGGTAERHELKIGSGSFIPGFEDQLIGCSKGDKPDVTVTFPEDYHAEDLAGKEAVFHCEIHEVKEEQLPPLDDDFAMDVSEYDTLEELKQNKKEEMQKSRDEWAANNAKDKLVDTIYKNLDIDVPDVMVEDEISDMIREMDQQLMSSGINMEQYLQLTGTDMKSMRDQLRDDARNRTGSRIVIRSIADQQNIEVSDEDVQKELERMSEAYGLPADDVKKSLTEEMEDYLKQDLKVRKCIDLLYDHANITKVDPPAPEEEKKEESEKTDSTPAEKAPEEADTSAEQKAEE